VRVLHRLQDLEPVAETLVTLPLTYSYAFANQWLWSQVFGRRLIRSRGLAEPDRLHAELKALTEGMLCLVGAQVPLLLQHYAGASFPGVIRLNFAGGRFPQEQLPALQQMFPAARIFNNYGCAEALPRLTVRDATEADDARVLGLPIDRVELMSDAGSGLQFRSPYGAVALVEAGVFREVGAQEWLATGDLAERLPDGCWRLAGRTGEVFKRYGEKISLAAIAATVESAWSRSSACYRETDPAGEEGYVLVLSPTADETALRAVLQAFRAAHPRPHWPLRIESVGAMPLSPNGKIDSAALVALPDKNVLWRQRL
jgi:acyl-CoA synthetase (AMP-forming)/AMP-acid ligase II